MNSFTVNGVERPNPIPAGECFGGLIKYIYSNMVGPESLVASIRVDGVEITEKDEATLAEVPLSNLQSVEVTFAKPRELAEETLQTLKAYTQQLADLSQKLATVSQNADFNQGFVKLVDGIQIFADTLYSVKAIMKVGFLQPVNLLEADLTSILKDLLDAHESGDVAYRTNLLKEHLPRNFSDWCNEGIPSLTRCRDS